MAARSRKSKRRSRKSKRKRAIAMRPSGNYSHLDRGSLLTILRHMGIEVRLGEERASLVKQLEKLEHPAATGGAFDAGQYFGSLQPERARKALSADELWDRRHPEDVQKRFALYRDEPILAIVKYIGHFGWESGLAKLKRVPPAQLLEVLADCFAEFFRREKGGLDDTFKVRAASRGGQTAKERFIKRRDRLAATIAYETYLQEEAKIARGVKGERSASDRAFARVAAEFNLSAESIRTLVHRKPISGKA